MKSMSAPLRKKQSFVRRLQIVFPVLLGLALVCAAPCWSRSYGDTDDQQTARERKHSQEGLRAAQENRFEKSSEREESSGGSNHLRNKAREWEQLPPQKQDDLRQRMDRFEKLPPEERRLYQKRFEQMRQLPPDQQKEIRNKLRNKDRLSPEEKEEIRKKFK